jgi:DNA-binding beta-propeller fold protein YncE
MSIMIKRLLASLLLAHFIFACASTEPVEPFAAEGPVWPPAPRQPRIAYLGEFSYEADLGVRPSLWGRIVSLVAGSDDNRMVRPISVVASNDHQMIFVADPDAGCVHRYDLGRHRYRCLTTVDETSVLRPVGLALVDEQWLIVSDPGQGQLYRAGIESDHLEKFYTSANLEQPTGISWSRSTESLYVTDTGQHVVLEFDRSGKLKRSIGGRGVAPGQFNYPTYVWADEQGELLVTDSLNFRLQRFDREGKFLHAFGESGDRPGDFSRPKGVATDESGRVYVVDALMHSVQIFDRGGQLLLAVGMQGQSKGEFWLPNGIFVTPDNMIFVADSYNKRVQVFRYVGPAT